MPFDREKKIKERKTDFLLMPPSESGLTRTDAEGARRRWRPRTLLGGGGGGSISLGWVGLDVEVAVIVVELL